MSRWTMRRHRILPIATAVGAIGDEMLGPRPALADLIQIICAAVLSEVRRRKVDQMIRPSVLTTMCCLRATNVLHASLPRASAGGAFVVWLSSAFSYCADSSFLIPGCH
jgi:hypothetical protein